MAACGVHLSPDAYLSASHSALRLRHRYRHRYLSTGQPVTGRCVSTPGATDSSSNRHRRRPDTEI